ncbi:MAG: hypothetical protein QOJ02_2538 [Acidobacteriota bacterium]|nr:hypothetical protein [Acidobacteriota bacterium]
MPPLRGLNIILTSKPRADALGYYHLAPPGLTPAASYVELTLPHPSIARGLRQNIYLRARLCICPSSA